jgi:glycosyltransferase involved in cell wall biosynthesis
MPRASVGLPVFNGERFLVPALEAILAQTLTDIEVIVSDNGSTDGTSEIVRGFAARDSRVRYVRHPENRGAAWNYNFVFGEAQSAYFKWLAHDDVCAPDFLERCVAALEERGPAAVLAFTGTRFIDAAGLPIRDYDAPIVWRGTSPAVRLADLLGDDWRSHLHRCTPVTGVIRSEALRKTRLIGNYGSADKVLLVELALLGDFIRVPEYLFLRRLHEDNSAGPNKTPQAIARWFDPRKGERFPMPRSTLFWNQCIALARAPIPLGQKLACLPVLARRGLREGRVMAGEVRIALRERLRSPLRADQAGRTHPR